MRERYDEGEEGREICAYVCLFVGMKGREEVRRREKKNHDNGRRGRITERWREGKEEGREEGKVW